jgi:hypothetical protein
MAATRPSVPAATKRALIREAGRKCANPGCPNRLTDLHHIREWAVYRTHDAEHMIAVCPTCHAHVHRGDLTIDDDTLYAWKRIVRNAATAAGHIYVEPSDQAKLLLGSIALMGEDAGLVAFELSENNRLAFALRDRDLLLLNLAVADRRSREIVKVVDGHVRLLDEDAATFDQRPGRARVTVPLHGRYLARRSVEMMRVHEPAFAQDGRLTMLDLEVVEPGLVRVQGVWTRGLDAVVITRERLAFVSMTPGWTHPISLEGAGAETVLYYTGPITRAAFNMGPSDRPPGPPYMW